MFLMSSQGLLLASIREPDPVIFFEPKALYRAAVEEVPIGDYMINIGEAVSHSTVHYKTTTIIFRYYIREFLSHMEFEI